MIWPLLAFAVCGAKPKPRSNKWRERARAETTCGQLQDMHKNLSKNMRRDGEEQHYADREGARETRVQARRSSTPVCRGFKVIMTRCVGLIQIASNPYRPELHYMRGPGPKWYAKYQGRTEKDPL
jgi:hypothetical protein